MKHTRNCPAYGNYQPPYQECDCGAETGQLRLHLEESFPKAKVIDTTGDMIVIEAPKEEWDALMTWLMNEFIPHSHYNEIHSLLNRINGKLAR